MKVWEGRKINCEWTRKLQPSSQLSALMLKVEYLIQKQKRNIPDPVELLKWMKGAW